MTQAYAKSLKMRTWQATDRQIGVRALQTQAAQVFVGADGAPLVVEAAGATPRHAQRQAL